MVKRFVDSEEGSRTATDWIRKRLYGLSYGVHSPEVVDSPFSSIMDSYMDMALFHRDLSVRGQPMPQVYFNESGEITRVVKGERVPHNLEEIYSRMGFFFEDEEY